MKKKRISIMLNYIQEKQLHEQILFLKRREEQQQFIKDVVSMNFEQLEKKYKLSENLSSSKELSNELLGSLNPRELYILKEKSSNISLSIKCNNLIKKRVKVNFNLISLSHICAQYALKNSLRRILKKELSYKEKPYFEKSDSKITKKREFSYKGQKLFNLSLSSYNVPIVINAGDGGMSNKGEGIYYFKYEDMTVYVIHDEVSCVSPNKPKRKSKIAHR